MDLAEWYERYQAEGESAPELTSTATPLLVECVSGLPPGRALDLACGTGRNALWLAQRGWGVTAVDGSPAAIDALRRRATQMNVPVNATLADLEKMDFAIAPESWDLIAICYYSQRNLFETCKRGVVPGGYIVSIALRVEPGKENSPFRLQPGELRSYFEDFEVVHDREGRDLWHHSVAEIIARRPKLSYA
jgi:tellurite methyltransferase